MADNVYRISNYIKPYYIMDTPFKCHLLYVYVAPLFNHCGYIYHNHMYILVYSSG